MRTFSGAEYNGTMSATRSGRPCVAWSETAFRASSVYRWRPHQQLWYGLAGDGQGVSHNRCRNVAATQRAPFCYVNADEWEECAVPYCDDGKALFARTSHCFKYQISKYLELKLTKLIIYHSIEVFSCSC